jgi:hypothetical protein
MNIDPLSTVFELVCQRNLYMNDSNILVSTRETLSLSDIVEDSEDDTFVIAFAVFVA